MRFLKNTGVFLASFCLCILTSSIACGSQFSDKQNPPSYLFIQSAQSATISKNNSPGRYTITLEKAEPWVTYFTDRPHRDMGFMSIEDFLSFMKKEEKKYEPKGLNVAIVSTDDRDKKYIFTLHDAISNAKNSDLTFQAELVPSKTGTPTLPADNTVVLKHAVLFIDACVGCTPKP